MIRLFYIFFVALIVVSCSGNIPIRYVKSVEDKPYYPFAIEYEMMPHDSFPLHYTVGENAVEDSSEYSYSFIRIYGDSVVWEEGVIKNP